MFAVPGWSVSTSTPVQQKSELKHRALSTVDALEPQRKKRKSHASDHKLSSTELQQLWNHSLSHNGEKVNKELAGVDGRDKVRSTVEQADATRNLQSHRAQKVAHLNAQKTAHRQKKRPFESAETVVETRPPVPPPLEANSTIRSAASRKAKNQRGHGGKLILEQRTAAASDTAASTPSQPHPPAPNLTPLQAKMRSKLTSARFRHLNQTLYTTSSLEALAMFEASPDLFAQYHAGFSQQVKDYWPENPVELYVKTLKRRGQLHDNDRAALPRKRNGSCIIADLGCGDAPLARGCQSQVKHLNIKFHNFDLHAPNSFVTVADIRDLPLRDRDADVAIFCLSLMGTNWISFVEEAWRVLRADGKGEVWVAEVKSRFGRPIEDRVVDHSVGKKTKSKKKAKSEEQQQPGGDQIFVEDDRTLDQPTDETDISNFVQVFQRRGFVLREGSVEKQNKMFVSMVFTKTGTPSAGKHKGLKWNGREYQKIHDGRMKYVDSDDEPSPEEEARALKPCVYKTR